MISNVLVIIRSGHGLIGRTGTALVMPNTDATGTDVTFFLFFFILFFYKPLAYSYGLILLSLCVSIGYMYLHVVIGSSKYCTLTHVTT